MRLRSDAHRRRSAVSSSDKINVRLAVAHCGSSVLFALAVVRVRLRVLAQIKVGASNGWKRPFLRLLFPQRHHFSRAEQP